MCIRDRLKEGRLGKRPFRLKDLPIYILMELWMIWNMVPYLWYRLAVSYTHLAVYKRQTFFAPAWM